MAWRSAVGIALDEAERCELEARTRRRKISRADAMRAAIVLLAADGATNLAIAEQLGVTRVTVATWRKRFAAKRLDGLADEPRPGAPRKIGDEKIAEVVTTTLETMPAGATHWKPPIQALGRTQPLLPMRPGQAERHTHDYRRHGPTSLFAALDVKAGTIIGKCMGGHRAQEFRRFLDTVEQHVPADLDIHIVMDNASSHKTKLIRDWFAKRLRWHMHFTPTSASWINQVERFFALLTDQQIKRGAHRSTAALEAAIAAYIDARNADPKPFRWTKTADDILASIERFCHRTIAVHAQCG